MRKLADAVRGDWAVSIRRACRVLTLDTLTYHHRSRRPGQAGLEKRIREICETRGALRLSPRARAASA